MLRARETITSHFGTPIHPVWLRCANSYIQRVCACLRALPDGRLNAPKPEVIISRALSVDSLLPSAQRSDHARLRAEFLRNPEVRRMGQGRKLEAVTADGRKILVEVGLNPYLDHGKQVVLASIIDLSGKQ